MLFQAGGCCNSYDITTSISEKKITSFRGLPVPFGGFSQVSLTVLTHGRLLVSDTVMQPGVASVSSPEQPDLPQNSSHWTVIRLPGISYSLFICHPPKKNKHKNHLKPGIMPHPFFLYPRWRVLSITGMISTRGREGSNSGARQSGVQTPELLLAGRVSSGKGPVLPEPRVAVSLVRR